MRVTEELRLATEESWQKSLHHPFVKGIVQGDLLLEKFKFYILQDIYYLKHYGKIHAIAASQAEDFALTAVLAEKAKLTAEAELTVHQEHAEILNISQQEIQELKPAPTAYAYTSHLYRASMSGSLAHTIAAILPCYWLYADIGKTYVTAQPAPKIYQNWLATYASDWFQTSTQEMIDLMDELAADLTNQQKAKIKEDFILSKEYELAFWEMAFTGETWLSEKS
ncbi:thiaminase II [Enterococcus sp. LJL90]